MRIVITTVGSRGDVQPYVALGEGLARRGHAVTLATHAGFEGLARAHGLAFFPLSLDPQALVTSESGLSFLDSAANPVAFIQRYGEIMAPVVRQLCEELLAAVGPAELVVYSPLSLPAYDFALARGVPAVLASPVPIMPTTLHPFMVMPGGWDFGPWGNWLTHYLGTGGLALTMGRHAAAWRAMVGLLPRRGWPIFDPNERRPVIQGISPRVLPRDPAWGPEVAQTGYWFLDEPGGWAPPAELEAFLGDGPPPVYVGFGSMPDRDPRKLAATVFEALELAGRRGVVLSGWAGLGRGDVPQHVHMVEDVPHAWLFPRMAAVVHHGGAGTTAAGLRAGVPAVVTPVFGDQPFWGARVHALGVGPRPLPRPRLTTWELAGALRLATEDAAMRERAAQLGRALRAEDGVAAACDFLGRWTT